MFSVFAVSLVFSVVSIVSIDSGVCGVSVLLVFFIDSGFSLFGVSVFIRVSGVCGVYLCGCPFLG